MTAPDERRLEARLRAAAPGVAWPATPDLRTAVLARIQRDDRQPVVGPAAAHPRPPALRLGRALLVALVALLVLAGVAAALGFRLPGLEILRTERLPPAGSGLDLGSPIPVEEALAFDRPRVLLPVALPPPDTAFELGAGDRRIVTLAYRATGGQATLAASDLALTVSAVPGTAEEGLIRKLVGKGVTVEPVSVGGSTGWWIAGAPHEIFVLRPDGDVGDVPAGVAGDTLLFARDGTLYRLETALGRDATIAIAGSMR